MEFLDFRGRKRLGINRNGFKGWGRIRGEMFRIFGGLWFIVVWVDRTVGEVA